jgi:hypothetical protein
LLMALWPPAAAPSVSLDRDGKLDALSSILGHPGTPAATIEQQLAALGPFPPDAAAARVLSDALVACDTSTMDGAERQRLAQELYAITVTTADEARVVARTMLALQQSIQHARCSPTAADALLVAARRVMTTEPNARKDWW